MLVSPILLFLLSALYVDNVDLIYFVVVLCLNFQLVPSRSSMSSFLLKCIFLFLPFYQSTLQRHRVIII